MRLQQQIAILLAEHMGIGLLAQLLVAEGLPGLNWGALCLRFVLGAGGGDSPAKLGGAILRAIWS